MTPLEQLAGTCPVREAGPEDQVDGVPARVVARPGSTEETSALLRACHAQGLAVVVRGHGTKVAWGRPPERLDVILETTAMDALVEHSRGDLIAIAGAGMPLARLAERLAEGGHQLVVDDLVADAAPPVAGAGGAEVRGSTLGGAVATNLCGPRRLWTGSVRDLVIGVRFVRADGTVAKAGGRVVKNVAGYDLAKLLTGSFGTLAVVTEVTVRLHPLPPAQRWVVLDVAEEDLATVLGSAVHSQTVPQALEVHARPGQAPQVAVLLGGTDGGVQARAARLVDVLAPLASRGAPSVSSTDRAPGWWARPLAAAHDERPVLVRATARISGVAELVAAAVAHGMTVTGSAGVGVLHALLPAASAPEDARAALDDLRAVSERLGGSTVVLDAPPEVKAVADSWGEVPGLDLMRRVKDEFDPTRALAPGRFVGGL
ncbi:FAD-binding oxidoreductase [uncultured Ornithinimicrobium sp.]|uniref:FAD-binding oxidoreductase n=1 Tax=uncultured Ornithinimicrobium sp. TaxID=259307 RepID=UPI0025992EC0|nr:FAD-binding oxidoreductase [uncultured Ornithinimicrobium sp.]